MVKQQQTIGLWSVLEINELNTTLNKVVYIE